MLWHVQRAERPILIAFLAQLAANLGAAEPCGDLYGVLRPIAGQMIVAADGSCTGSVDAVLGLLATTMGNWRDAEAHFREASAREASLRSAPISARTNYWWARMLASWPDGDDERARALAQSAKQAAESMMMTGLASEAEMLLRQGSPSARARMSQEVRERRRRVRP
jgi:hypothetical protein